jgi:uncharacterized protein HemX
MRVQSRVGLNSFLMTSKLYIQIVRRDRMVDHKIHRNTLYTLVILLAALQLVSFLVLSAQVSRLTVNLENEIQQSRDELRQERNLMFEDYNTVYQNNFNEIVRMLSNQQDSLEEQISNLKSIQDDFSGVVDDSVRVL